MTRALALLLIIAASSTAQAGCSPPCEIEGWQQFERRVRDDLIPYEEGLKEIQHWWGVLQRAYPAGQFDGRIFFPLRGYGLKQVGGRRGEGYRPSRYEFVGPKRRIGHPAQDIFVHDGNQDSLDDRTGAPFEVLSLADGVVVSTFAEWTPTVGNPGNGGRGGNYVWIYHPAFHVFAYYAHLKDIGVTLGERVAGGQSIATLGRTGTNACAERSPTHLHLMLLRAESMAPLNAYQLLEKAAIEQCDKGPSTLFSRRKS